MGNKDLGKKKGVDTIGTHAGVINPKPKLGSRVTKSGEKVDRKGRKDALRKTGAEKGVT